MASLSRLRRGLDGIKVPGRAGTEPVMRNPLAYTMLGACDDVRNAPRVARAQFGSGAA